MMGNTRHERTATQRLWIGKYGGIPIAFTFCITLAYSFLLDSQARSRREGIADAGIREEVSELHFAGPVAGPARQ